VGIETGIDMKKLIMAGEFMNNHLGKINGSLVNIKIIK
jgi:hypothetical protein